tara:strand:- start:2482 stop:4734 length:2253 start_codon:yes stop_codon:yes gene_type:complete
MGAYLHAIKIEGIGDVSKTTTDGLFRYCYSRDFLANLATSDPDGLYKTGLLTWPEELSASIDFRDGRATSASQGYSIRADKAGALWGELMRFRHVEVAELIDDMTASQETIQATASGLNGAHYIGRECININGATQSTVSGGFQYDCLRGKLGTHGRRHLSGVLDDKYLYTTPHVLAGRLVQLIRVPTAGASAYAEEVLWSGVLREVATGNGGLTIDLEVDSILQLVADSTILQDRCEGVAIGARDNGVGATFTMLTSAKIPPVAGNHLSSNQAALFRVGDHLVEGQYELAGSTQNGDQLAFVVDVPTRDIFAGLPLPEDITGIIRGPMAEVFSTRADAPSNDASPGDNDLPLSANPGKLIAQLLTTTPNNDNGAGPNGTFDTGIDALAGDIPAGLVDTSALEAWGDSVGVEFRDLYIGLDSAPVTLAALIKTLCAPLLSVLIQTRAGKLKIVRLEDLAPFGDAFTITQSQILTIGIPQARGLVDALDKVTVKFGHLPGLEPNQITGRDSIKYHRQPPGQHSALELSMPGVVEADIVSMAIKAIIGRFHDPIPVVQLSCLATADFEIGAVVAVTHPFIFKADATRGASAASMLIVERREVFTDEEHRIDYTLLNVGLIHPRSGYIAPSGRVKSSPSPSAAVFTIETNDFTTSATLEDDPFAADIGGFAVGDKLEVLNQFGAPTGATNLEIQAIAGNQITLTGAASPAPVAGDIVRPARYAQSVTTQQDNWLFVADASNQLGGADPKTYRT